mmetsp:Transcript_24124/g.82318  ORF Transcript_24124/g.82318 Transcript_24124/m.82318 type:complete len:248 (+) Transcript_24124:268-1011(+)
MAYGECWPVGKARDATSALNSASAPVMTEPTSAYRLQNLGVTLAWCGCCMKPSRSWYTSTCPLHCGPAPIPIVGMSRAAVTAAATAPGTHSSTTAKHPARCSASALSTTAAAPAASRPCGLKPPRTDMACGVSPTCPITAIPASAMALALATRATPPPSSFTASIPPSLSTLTAARTACSVEASYAPNGRSPTSSGLLAPLATALQCVSMSSSVTGSVVSWPCTTIPALSPTSATSTPAWSTCTALG